MDKYELVNRSKTVETPYGEAMVFQIRALIDLPDIGVKAGDLGGYIGDERCLSHANQCWVFAGSSVTLGSRVRNRAQVKGNSMVTGHSIVRGTAVVIDSEILSGSTVQGNSRVKSSDISEKCIISGNSNIQTSRLRSVKLVDSQIVDSTVQSLRADQLVFEKPVDIDNSHLEMHADEPFVMKKLLMKRVTAIDVVEFRIFEETSMIDVVFEGETSLLIGKVNSPVSNATCLIGGSEGLLLDGVKLTMTNSSLLGDGEVKGNIELENSTVEDIISITNDMDDPLHLLNVNVSECVSFYKYYLKGRTTIRNEQFRGDVKVTL